MNEDNDSAAAMCDACCYEDNEPMGVLGRRAHYRCRACGWEWSQLLEYASRDDARLDRGQVFA